MLLRSKIVKNQTKIFYLKCKGVEEKSTKGDSNISHFVASNYGPCVAQRPGELGEDTSQLCSLFVGVPILIRGDLNVTIAPKDRPNGMGGVRSRICATQRRP